jgi:very-short-patch-repair endonuclease
LEVELRDGRQSFCIPPLLGRDRGRGPLREGVVSGQKVDGGKLERAREMRRNMTAEESILWARLRGNRIGGHHFRRQQVIDGFIVDFYCHRAGLVVEVDGLVHDGQVEYDAQRDRILSGRGLRILRVTNEEVKRNLEGVIDRIAANLT